jgi:hypothetical protein
MTRFICLSMRVYAIAMAKRKAAITFAFLLTWLLCGCTLPEVSTSGQNSHTLTIAAVGDFNGYNIEQTENQLNSIGKLLSGKDIFIFNAEGVFSKKLRSEDCHRFRHQSLFLGSSKVMDYLPATDIAIASLANNHVLDCGQEGLLETMQELKKRGITSVGAGENVQQSCKPLMLQLKGLNVAVLAYLEIDPAVLSYIGMVPDWFSSDHRKAVVASWKLCNGQKQITEIRKVADIVLVFVHMHYTKFSWTENPSTASILFVKNILDAGADLVVGSGPHVPQGIISSDKGVGLLSLGNFLFRPDYSTPEEGRRSILANFIVSDDSLKLVIVPLRLDVLGIPHVALQDDAGIVLNRIVSLSGELGTTIQVRGGKGYLEVRRMPINSSSRTGF